MVKIYSNNREYAKNLMAELVDSRSAADVEVYVLKEDMNPLDLLIAFRACRENPLKAMFFIPKTKSMFSVYAYDAIKRGTLKIFEDWNELSSYLREYYSASKDFTVTNCIRRSLDNFGISLPESELENGRKIITDTIDRYGVYGAAYAMLRMLQSGKQPTIALYNTVLRSVMQVYASAEISVDNYRLYHSHILCVLAAAKINVTQIENQKEFDSMAVMSMLKPFTPDMVDLEERRNLIVRIAKEHLS